MARMAARIRLACCVALSLAAVPVSRAYPASERMGERLCTGLSDAVREIAPAGSPIFVASYRPGPGEAELPAPLRTSAFVYDNALAAIALVACGKADGAARIGDALVAAIANDRTFRDGRLRNAYRAGAVAKGEKALLPGWWDGGAGLWAEDQYQDGSATGNIAWGALALLTLHDATGKRSYADAAGALLRWIAQNTEAQDGIGFTGGVDGFDPGQTRLTWASTEHNVDIAAVAAWHDRITGTATFAGIGRSARAFLARSFLKEKGCFVLGTEPDGTLAGPSHLALDTQLWPLLLSGAPKTWHSALTCAETQLSVPGGFDFDNDRDGLWVEGTAQAALLYRHLRRAKRSAELLDGLQQDISPSGWLYATRGERLTTGLKIGPQSVEPDFFYFRRPHLGATAWAAIAAQGWNPFTGKRE
jgi:hypothetical protein